MYRSSLDMPDTKIGSKISKVSIECGRQAKVTISGTSLAVPDG